MKQFVLSCSKILVALDLSPFDFRLLNYCNLIAKVLGARAIDFVHVVPAVFSLENPAWNLEDLVALDLPVKERINAQLAGEVRSFISANTALRSEIHILEGKTYGKLLSRLREEKTDLLVMGKKKYSDGSGLTPRRMARNTECMIWFVTETAATNIQTIAVPIDFSDYSKRAIQTALYFQEHFPHPAIHCLHVVELPAFAWQMHDNYQKIVEQIRKETYQGFEKFIRENNLPQESLIFEVVFNEEMDTARHISEWASNVKADLIIIGAKGHAPYNDFLIGSVTEKLVDYETTTPVLVIR